MDGTNSHIFRALDQHPRIVFEVQCVDHTVFRKAARRCKSKVGLRREQYVK